jgi:hypothetical protein
VGEALDRRLFDRSLYRAAAIVFSLIVLAGFARTYYAKVFFESPPLASWLVHAHGALMTMWVALFATQVWLISARRIRLHQRLGYASLGLAVVLVAVGFVTAVRAAKFGAASTPPGISPQAFMIVPLFDLIMFVILFGGALYFRRRPAEHKRLMLLTAVNFLPPAVARIPAAGLQALGPVWFFGFPGALALTCIVLDARHHGRVNRIFVAGTLLLLASYVVRLAVMPTATWLSVSRWLTSFV